MSVIFGIRDKSERLVDVRRLEDISNRTLRFAPDGSILEASNGIGMGFQPYHTHKRSGLGSGPFTDALGNMIVFDGRLDNYAELGAALDLDSEVTADSHLVLVAFLRWGEKAFSRLIGDWAFALWSAIGKILYLVRDHAGTRTLYFEDADGEVRWSTYLESFSTRAGSRTLNPLYVARYLARLPIGELTPYQGIYAVPAAQFVAVKDRLVYGIHWSGYGREQLRYKNDSEYDEHFLSLFHRAVDRRTVGINQVIAQLSGGIDSTSIVCMADLIARENAAAQSSDLETISYYDDLEPNWDERPYFSQIEVARGKIGFHFQTSFRTQWFGALSTTFDCCLPGVVDSSILEERAQDELLSSKGFRVILSGLGGDELLGGNPNPLPELADCLIAGHIGSMVRRSVAYCLVDRTPLVNLLRRVASYTKELYFDRGLHAAPIPAWIHPQLRRLLEDDSLHTPRRIHQYHLVPSMLEGWLSWLSILESLPHLTPSVVARREYRYPYLDRDLVEFLLRVPREQIVKPGRRRYLMRRALKRIVPSEILERRRKAFLLTGPLVCLQRHETVLGALLEDASLKSLNLFDGQELRKSMVLVQEGLCPSGWPSLFRLMLFVSWLRNKGRMISCQL